MCIAPRTQLASKCLQACLGQRAPSASVPPFHLGGTASFLGPSTLGDSAAAPASLGLAHLSPNPVPSGMLSPCSTWNYGSSHCTPAPPQHNSCLLQAQLHPPLPVWPCSSAAGNTWVLMKTQLINAASDLCRQTATFLVFPPGHPGSVTSGSQALGRVPGHWAMLQTPPWHPDRRPHFPP